MKTKLTSKNRAFLLFVIVSFILMGCEKNNNPSPTPTSTNTTASTTIIDQIYKNGIYSKVTAANYTGGVTSSNINLYDSITHDDTVLAITASFNKDSTSGSFLITRGVDPVQSSFLSGHLQFDIMLDSLPANTFTSMILKGETSNDGINWTIGYVPLSISGFSNKRFVHYSIALSSLFLFSNTATNYIKFCFEIDLTFTNSYSLKVNHSVYLNDIKWTSN